MIELIQLPWCPFCRVQRRLLEYAGARFRVINIPVGDRSQVWRLTKHRYYQVPVIKDGRSVVFEVDDESQVIAKYLDTKLQLGLFPRAWEGVQSVLWRYIERDIAGPAAKLNDVYWTELVPRADQLAFLREREIRFGRGCLEQWRAQQADLLRQLEQRLTPFETMLANQPFLLGNQPRFVDFDLYGMLATFLYSGHYRLPPVYTRLDQWYRRMGRLRANDAPAPAAAPKRKLGTNGL